MTADDFGFLSNPLDISFEGGAISTRDDFEETAKGMDRAINRDGYFYPVMVYTATQSARSNRWRRVPKTNRPAMLFRVPPSHKLILNNCPDQPTGRSGLGAFIIHSLAFLYGTKLQFYDWWVEGRIPIRKCTVDIRPTPRQASTFLSRAIPSWLGLTEETRKIMLNLLYVYNVAGAIEWDWQHFLLEYMVTDACYAVIKKKVNAKDHPGKLIALAQELSLATDQEWFSCFPHLRRHLFHETIWDGGQIFTAQSSKSVYAPIFLRRFNSRAITAILCGQNRYSKSGWTSLGTSSFALD